MKALETLVILLTLFILLLLLIPIFAHAEPIIGQDILALQSKNFSVKNAVKYISKNSATGSLDTTFGTDTSQIRALLSSVHPAIHRVHIFNGSGVRSKNLGTYDILYGLSIAEFDRKIKAHDPKIIQYFRNRVSFYKSLQAEFPTTKIYLSPVLEHNLSIESWRILAENARSVWPDVQLVNSPEGNAKAQRYLGCLIERHGSSPYRDFDLVSLDGTDGSDIDVHSFLNKTLKAKIVFLWTRSYNCRNLGPWQDPRNRKSCPTSSTFELMNHLADDRGKVPSPPRKVCKTIIPFKSPMIWKPLAENNDSGDIRADLPVVITPEVSSSLSIVASNGKQVGTLGLYGPYKNGLYRHYSRWKGGSGLGGYSFEKKAKEVSESSYIWLKSTNKCIGPLVTGKRQGDYR